MRYPILIAFAALQLFAGPNFTGAWKLNLAKSAYGNFPAPQSVTRTILHDGSQLSMTTLQKGQQGETTTTLVYTTDGKPVTNKTATGESQSVVHLMNGTQLVIETTRALQGGEIKSVETWELSADGKTLTIQTKLNLPGQGDFVVKQVFEKQ
jgi:hypothetical protein